MNRKDKNPFEAAFDLFDAAKEFYDENQDTIDNVVKAGSSVSLEQDEPLKEAYKEDDKVIIVAEAPDKDKSDISLRFNKDESSMVVTIGGDDLKVMMPEDVSPEDTEARLKNGVFRAEVPRGVEEDEE